MPEGLLCDSNFDVVDEVFGDDFVHHLPIPGVPPGRDGMKGVGRLVTGAIGDMVWIRVRC